MNARENHEELCKALGISIDLAGRAGFVIGDPRLFEMVRQNRAKIEYVKTIVIGAVSDLADDEGDTDTIVAAFHNIEEIVFK